MPEPAAAAAASLPSAGGGAAVSSMANYDFDAPKHYDFSADGYTEKEREGDRQALNLFLSRTKAQEHRLTDDGDPWEFDAPTWADLSEAGAVSINESSQPVAQVPMPPPPARQVRTSRTPGDHHAVGASSGQSHAAAHPRAAAGATSSSSVRRTAADVTGRSAMATSARRMASTSTSIGSARHATTAGAGDIVVAGAAVDPSRHSFVLQAAGAVQPPPPPSRGTPAATATARTGTTTAGATGTTTSKLAQRTFVQRPRKEPSQAPMAPVQHSYLQNSQTRQHTVAKKRVSGAPATTAPAAPPASTTKDVHQLSSFLRPTQASWQRNQKEKETVSKARAAAAAAKPPAPHRQAYGRVPPPSSKAVGTTARATTTSPVIKGETTEEREMRLAAKAKERLKKQIEANKVAFERNRVVGSTAANPLRSAKPLTIPVSPRMMSKERLGEKVHPAVADQPPPPPPRPAPKGPRAPTVPQSPAITKSRLVRPQPYTTLANVAPVKPRTHSGPVTLTQPHPPALKTEARAAMRKGPAPFDPHALEDEEELQHQFKARPLDQRILHSNGEFGVPKVTPSEVTHPKPFHFATEDRAAKRPGSKDDDHTHDHHMHQHEDHHDRHHLGASRGHHHPHQPQLVTPQPFALATERRGQMHKMAFEQRLEHERELEKAQREVHANPVPRFDHTFQPHPSNKELTEFADFQLQSVRRHEESRVNWEESVRRLQEEEVVQRQVKARPLPASTFHKTFEVKPSEREPLVAMSVNLNTSVRAEERKAFDEELQQKLQEAHASQEAALEEAKRAEQQEMRRLRTTPVEQGGMQFKAKPVRHVPQPLVPAPSSRKLTVPISPKLTTAVRSVHHRNTIQHHDHR